MVQKWSEKTIINCSYHRLENACNCEIKTCFYATDKGY
ncbi:hypothetical protein LRU_02279 [Ligilactobacillus ruminis SPM0211]|uniref:Uncharacterized protein n=1 Tax=Ligilactobacillus ruminis SPM0211 TaxID=1040964 RepID=F7R3K9_9LACO|nr:hypothetical protein LRU_02279 [Ligilactobacillus ruminis SPM0211]